MVPPKRENSLKLLAKSRFVHSQYKSELMFNLGLYARVEMRRDTCAFRAECLICDNF